MMVLTGVSLKNDLVQVFDSEDGTNEKAKLSVLAQRLRGMDDRIYGLRLYRQGDFYPPDSKLIPQVGVVIVPSEAREAMRKINQSS